MKSIEPCPVCQWSAEIQQVDLSGVFLFGVSCPRCGLYQIDRVVRGYLNLEEYKNKLSVLSHAIRKAQKSNEYLVLDLTSISRILQNSLPKPSDQMNNFVLWLGNNSQSFGDKIPVKGVLLQAEIGARTQEGVLAIVNYLHEKKYIEQKREKGTSNEPLQWDITLRMEGWEYYEKIKQGQSSSRRAFIAMKFNDADLDNILSSCFRPAVKDAGFDLFRLDDVPKAGLIDDRLRVEIRASRFLIADLTHENAGAYWESGYAEGLGKPVIYTCEKKKFEEKKTHFDTNHHTTILWSKDDLESTARNLKNTIRATLPEEAKINDD